MKSGMKVQLSEFGETQVIGEIKDNKFTEIWGVGYQGGYKMSPSGKMLRDILDACQKADMMSVIAQAKLDQDGLENRLDWIKSAADKINKEVIAC